MTEKQVRVMADFIQDLLLQIDIFTQVLTKEDFEVLEKAKNSLQTKINFKRSATPLLFAVGANSDTTKDRMELKSLTLLIELMKARTEFREEMLRLQKDNQNKQETVKLFENMGIL